jgi:hypothetical protein
MTPYTVGNDLRKIASDGFPPQNMIASDLRQGSSLPVEALLI